MEYLGSIRAQESMTCHHLTKLLTQMSRNCPRYRISNPGKPVSSSSLDLNLIDIISKHQHIPRPTLDHIKYENWLKWSQNLSKWLILTDEAYLAIINLLPDAEDTESRAFMKLWTMRWYQFRSFHAFVSTCRAQASICKEVSYCWLPTLLILHELKGEMPDLAHYINFQIGESPDEPERMMYRQFDRIVGGILHTLNRDNQSSLQRVHSFLFNFWISSSLQKADHCKLHREPAQGSGCGQRSRCRARRGTYTYTFLPIIQQEYLHLPDTSHMKSWSWIENSKGGRTRMKVTTSRSQRVTN
ncbi:hypothetical protein DTO027I6_8981 [Penicillium roqueforti]|nr:hypothetical protein CBS147337_9044 [Penicillium roqueforti]KAI2675663.1 hypothetical protein LCP963914a_8500 [Penicillium roqueforti]KAI2695002.1 hypothetical protein CBS147372_9476 [Penicillium roqueforti]KAI3118931.1 hypothetical protein CBS147330_8763 [Penicillium roqueforti]KAI3146895.1 hypothetical protein CBS147317_9041 [Penicillium roqueforti]